MNDERECAWCHAASAEVRSRHFPNGEYADLCADCWLDVQTATQKGRYDH